MSKLPANLILTLILAVLGIAATVAFNRAAAPYPKILPLEGVIPPDSHQVLKTITEASIRRDLKKLCRPASRFSGTPGCEETADFLKQELQSLQYEVHEQTFEVTVPKTRQAKILDQNGNDIPGVKLLPLLPNWFRTCTTPPAGLTGKVFQAEKGLAREFEKVDLRNNFALLPLGTPWNTVTAMGAAAVLYYDTGENIPHTGWKPNQNASLNIPRFFISGNARKLAGKTIKIKARIDFSPQPVRNIIAVLKAPDADADAREALIISTWYDSYSYTPDLAPGAEQACSPAALLATARQLATDQKNLRRDVILLATAGHAQGLFGIREFMRSLGTSSNRKKAVETTGAEKKKLEEDSQTAADLVRIASSAYWQQLTADSEKDFWQNYTPKIHEAFQKIIRETLDVHLMNALEGVTQTRLNWIRSGMQIKTGDGKPAPVFTAYNQAREKQSSIEMMKSTPLLDLKTQWKDSLIKLNIQQETLERAKRHVARLQTRLKAAETRVMLAEILARYQRILFMGIDLSSRSRRLALVSGSILDAAQCIPADSEIMVQLQAAGESLNEATNSTIYVRDSNRKLRAINLLQLNDEGSLPYIDFNNGSVLYFQSTGILWSGYTAFTLAGYGDKRPWVGTPFDSLDKITHPKPPKDLQDYSPPLTNLLINIRILSMAVNRLARGAGRIIPPSLADDLYTIRGQAVSRVGENLTPDHPVSHALIRFCPPTRWGWPIPRPPGMGSDIILTADDNGFFTFSNIWANGISREWLNAVDMDAALIRSKDGEITWTLSEADSGPQAPYTVKKVKIAQYRKSLAMPVLFRCQPVQVVPMVDPATFKPYAGLSFIEKKSRATPQKMKVEQAGGAYVCFVPPSTRLYFTFKNGSPLNPNLMITRAFALNAQGTADGTDDPDAKDISGPGYLAADNPRITNIEFDVARSMAQVNSRRIRLQQKYNMADELLVRYNKHAVALANKATAWQKAGKIVEGKRAASESVAYSANIHPVIRQNIRDAIIGIIFYLALALPFAIFLEKLLIGSTDIRYQLAGQGVIFLAFFFALRAVHPAYQLVRSSFMILLGFLTCALALFIGNFVCMRFINNIKELQNRLQERAEVADVSRAGAAMSAFLLGLGHMRKRPVRTTLTVGTLLLTTFVMLCFTSVTSNIRDVEFSVGKAPYTGLFIRDRNFGNVASSVAPLQELYGRDQIVVQRRWGGIFSGAANSTVQRAEIILKRSTEKQRLETVANAVLGLSVDEPKITKILDAMITPPKWFENRTDSVCYLPQELADSLHINEQDVADKTATITIAGKEYTVAGIFNGHKLENILDLDGQSMLPLDVLGLLAQMQSAGDSDGPGDTPEDIPRLPGSSIIITPTGAMPMNTEVASIAVAFRNTDYATARALIDSHLERSGRPCYYGIDGIAFYGGKFRTKQMSGWMDLFLPILIAALTVLNTMRGSVYERQDELYVFNAVGLSPTHIRWLFFAEACVYAVVGAVGGYLLAQGIGSILQMLGVTAGLTMNYSSLASVLVSVVIMVVVFASSLLPARMAAQLAAPAETMTRKRETSEGDIMEFELPFTFNQRDRIAIIPYFEDWFDNYGEGSAGEFFCSPSTCGILTEKNGKPSPYIQTTTWLKPYDLGVSQDVTVVVRHNEDGDNVAVISMVRKSGDRDSWERCCHRFIGMLRKRFLTWRAVDDINRSRLLERGREILKDSLADTKKTPMEAATST